MQMLGDRGSVDRRLFALVLVAVLGLISVGGAAYAGAVMMRRQSVRAAHLQLALVMQQDADMVHDMLRSDVLVSLRGGSSRRDMIGIAQQDRGRAMQDMRVSDFLLARSDVSPGLVRQARADAAALRRYADQAVRAAAAPVGAGAERPRVSRVSAGARDQRRVSMAGLTNAIQAEVSSADRDAFTTSRAVAAVTATVAVTALVMLLALAMLTVRSIRRILLAKAQAENAQALQNVALRDQADALVEADQVKGRLLAVTSHEIRGSLGATIVSVRTAQRLTERGTPDQLRAALHLAERHADHVLSVVVDVLSEQRQSRPQTQQQWNDVFEIAQLAVDAAERNREGHRLQLEVPPMVCDVDANRLQQVLRNLIENAYKYTPSRCHVLVRATPETHHLLITVADDGPGLPAHLTGTLLQAYQRGPGPHPPGTGSGLGLFVVNELVRAMKGTLDVVSQPGVGTRFTIRVPCTPQPGDEPDQQPANAATGVRQ
jgi:signal transduction histidine kinase